MAKIAVITGGHGDLARAVAEVLRERGYEVLAPGREELDVRNARAVADYFAGVEEIDLFVNNAGVLRDTPVVRMEEKGWDEVLGTNLRGAFLCSRAALKLMCRRRAGHIVNIGSNSARSGPVGQANYASAKAGLIGLTQSIAKEVGTRNVRANCVLPGFLETKMTAEVDPAVVEAARNANALGRFNTVEEVAEFIAHLHGMANVSGQVFQLDSRVSRWT